MLNVSIVLYNHWVNEVSPLVAMLRQSSEVKEIFLIDNSPVENTDFLTLPATYIFNNKNLGYGAAHNIAIRKTLETATSYHLVLNPDVRFNNKAIGLIVGFMNTHPDVGHLMPKVFYPDGRIQYLCKLLPTPADLIFRRFLPFTRVRRQLERFELRASGYDDIMDVPYLSGCFMFLRSQALSEAGLFDERFFMYPEDIDLTRRIYQKYRTVFYPGAQIIHYHAQSSYCNLKMLVIHAVNIIRYFNKWGWFFDKERKKVNLDTLRKLNLL